MALQLTITHDLDRLRDNLRLRLTDARPVWKRFAQYMRVRTDNTFDRLRRGGSYRGVTWKYFAPQYLGQLRPSGARVRDGDAIMQDTMTLRSRAALVMRMTPRSLVLGPQGVRYAAAQQAMRPFLFFDVPTDINQLERLALEDWGGR